VNFALIFISIVAAKSLWGLLGGDPQEQLIDKLNKSVNLLSKSKKSGLVDFETDSEGYMTNTQWVDKLACAKSDVCLMGYTLKSWLTSKRFSEEIIKLSKDGVKIRIMVMHEENLHFDALINLSNPHNNLSGIKGDITAMTDVLSKINEELKENKPEFVKVKKGIITSQISIFDSEMYVIPYMYTAMPGETPLFASSGKECELMLKYKKEFDDLFKANENYGGQENE
jgi:hypothetical protein